MPYVFKHVCACVCMSLPAVHMHEPSVNAATTTKATAHKYLLTRHCQMITTNLIEFYTKTGANRHTHACARTGKE